MQYQKMIEFHDEMDADSQSPSSPCHGRKWSDWRGQTRRNQRVVEFYEKNPNAPSNLASLGIYVFKKEVLEQSPLRGGGALRHAQDFGKNIIPDMKERGDKIYGYIYTGYWRDVGTVQAFWESSMDCLNPQAD
jgi:glucose-1-phosphate adenylyltransferase